MGRAKQITRALRSYDSKLYCDKSRDGKLCIYRKAERIESYEVDGHIINFVRPAPYFVFALTDNWKLAGEPANWGLLPIMEKLRSCDLWHRDVAEESIQSIERANESRSRDFRNSAESFLYEFRDEFKAATNDVNVSSLEKIDRKRKDEKSYGNY